MNKFFNISRAWFNFSFENPEKISPNHSALLFFAVEHCNRLGWKDKFGLPTTMAKEAIGIKSYTTYIKTLNDLVAWGFIIMIEKSKNQYSANIIALPDFDKALDKALDKAFVKHLSKQSESTYQSKMSIDNNNTIQQEETNIQLGFNDFFDSYDKKLGDLYQMQKMWFLLSSEEKKCAIDFIPKYRNMVSGTNYMLNANNYLAQKLWERNFSASELKKLPANLQETEL